MKRLREAPKRMRAAEPVEEREAADQREVVRHGLAEADPRVDEDARRAGCPPPRRRRPAPRGSRRRRAARRRRPAPPASSAGRPARASGRPAGRTPPPARGSPGRGVRAETSLRRSAPASKAARATAALRVSIEIGSAKPSARSAAITGTTRAASSSTGTGSAPGRVDSPPMSRMSAPSAARARACAIAAARPRCAPPSEKLSGVTFSTPMIRGRSRPRPQIGARGAARRPATAGGSAVAADEPRRGAAAMLGHLGEPERAAGERHRSRGPRTAAPDDRPVADAHAEASAPVTRPST